MNSNKVEPKTLPGFMELTPNEQVKFNQMMEIIRTSYEKFGFLPIDTPIIEFSDVLLAKAGGETEKQIYRFSKGETDLSLRFDHTVPLAKYVALYYDKLTFPFKRYAIGKVYRGEKAQKGRYREFYQCDVDIIGEGELSIINDAQISSIIYTTFCELGFKNFTICINNRKILNGLFENLKLSEKSTEILRIIDKIDKIGEEAVETELSNLELNENSIEKIMQFISIKGSNDEKLKKISQFEIEDKTFNDGVQELTDVIKYIRALGVPETNFAVDLRIARGLDYYTGTVYETFLNDYKKIGSICSGGRFENLAEYYTDKKLPGVGVSIGLTRLFYQLQQINEIKVNKESIADILIIPMEVKEDTITKSLEIANKLRMENINVDIYLDDTKIKKKMRYADKCHIPYALIIGEEEIKSELYSLKDMNTGEQKRLSIEEVAAYISCK